MDPSTSSIPLRDIHLPDSVSWWPLAPGWWVTLGLLVLAALVVYVLKKARNKQLLSKQILEEFNNCVSCYQKDNDVNALLVTVSQLLRRVSITQYEHDKVAALIGNDWLAFLDEAISDRNNAQQLSFRSELGEFLIAGQYQPLKSVDQKKLDQLLVLCKAWLVSTCHRPVRRFRSVSQYRLSGGEN